jgi:hypothetical protein
MTELEILNNPIPQDFIAVISLSEDKVLKPIKTEARNETGKTKGVSERTRNPAICKTASIGAWWTMRKSARRKAWNIRNVPKKKTTVPKKGFVTAVKI